MRFSPIRKACFGVLAFSVLLCQSSWQAFADPNFTQDLETWQIAVVQGHITKRILGYLDTQNNEINLTGKQGNSANNHTEQGQLLVRPALGFQVSKGWSVWQGYGWTPSFQPRFRNENQIWEQTLYQHRFKHFAFSNRTRLEIRWIQDAGGTAVRLRNNFRVTVPLGKTRWSLVAFDEPFFNMNTVPNGPRQGFNQNWAFLGIGRRLTNTLNLDVGYINNYVRNFQPVPDRMNHVIFVGLNFNVPGTGFDLHKPNPSHTPPVQSKSSIIPVTALALGQTGTQADVVEAPLSVNQPILEIAPITKAVKDKAAPENSAAKPEDAT